MSIVGTTKKQKAKWLPAEFASLHSSTGNRQAQQTARLNQRNHQPYLQWAHENIYSALQYLEI
jgi:hypothetical protein